MKLDGLDVGSWVRVSSEGQVKEESPEVHLKRNQDYADLYRLNVREVYRLDAISGESILNHPETQRMWRDIEAGRIKGLVFSAVARIGRDLIELLMIEKHLRQHGAVLISTRRGVIDTSTPEGMNGFVMQASRAQDERLELSARVKAGLKTRAKLGQVTAALIPYGYRKINRQLVIDPVEGPIRASMYHLYLEHRRLMVVAALLNADGHRTQKGRLFTHVTIKALLKDTTAKGVYYANRTGSNNVFKPADEWIEIACPALVSEDVWGACQRLMAIQGNPGRRLVYPYSGLLRCHCGCKMYVRANYDQKRQAERWPPRYECRACGNRILLKALDGHMSEMFAGFALSGLPVSAKAEASQTERQLSALAEQLARVNKDLAKLMAAYKADALTLPEFKAERGPLVNQKHETESAIARLQADLRTDADQRQAQTRAAEVIQSAAWAELQASEKARILETFVRELVLEPEGLVARVVYASPALQVGVDGKADDTNRGTFPFAKVYRINLKRPDIQQIWIGLLGLILTAVRALDNHHIFARGTGFMMAA